jgi:hypothetical protein
VLLVLDNPVLLVLDNPVLLVLDNPVLLVLDNHDSHCTLGAILFCRDNYITLLSIPPHGSRNIQPLDCGFFGPLESTYSQECDAFLVNNVNRPITQRNVAGIFKRAYWRVATLDKAQNSFRDCGIYPYNSHVFSPKDFGPAQVSFLPNTEEKTTTDATVILQGDELSPKPSSSTSGAAPSDILASDTSVEPSASRTYTSLSKSHVSPTMIRPVPRTKVSNHRKKARQTKILSSSPHKNSLQEQCRQKVTEDGEKKSKCKRRVVRRTLGDETVVSASNSVCPACGEEYQDPPEEDWIQCYRNKDWWHEACTMYESGQFTCNYYST